MSFSVIQHTCKFHSDHLEDLEQDDQQCDRDQHDIRLPAVVTVLNRDVTQSAACNRTCHGGISKDCSKRDRRSGDQGCLRFH